MVGGAVGGAVGKKVMDNFIEDDAVAMFRVMKEEFFKYSYVILFVARRV